MSGNNHICLETDNPKAEDKKKLGCWSKFKSLFEDKGFDLNVEYGDAPAIRLDIEHKYEKHNVTGHRNDEPKHKRPPAETLSGPSEQIEADDELSGVINFYEQFATLDDAKEEPAHDDWRRITRLRNRVSVRPSVFLTNITEETLELDDEETVVVKSRLPPPYHIPPALLYAPPEPLEVICVFGESGGGSRVGGAARSGAARAGGEARLLNARDALDAVRREGGSGSGAGDARAPHVLVVDARVPHQVDALQLARSVRTSKNTQHLILIAVVKKSVYLKDEFVVLPYIEAGFNRVMVETTSAGAWCAELLQARAAAATQRAQLAAVAALAAAADRCRDLVAVTDDQQRILMTNKAWSRALGWRTDETSKPLGEVAGGEALRLAASSARDWEAPLSLKRRASPDSLLVPCRGTSIALTGSPSHVVLVCEAGGGPAEPRGSLHSIRRGSLDVRSVASDGLRRTSLAKLQGLPLEAPITKVITLLSAATDGAAPATVALVERAVDMLRTSELYSPQMKDDRYRTEDPIATDLIGALLSQGPTNVLSSRRSSNDSTVIRSSTARPNIKHKTPGQLRELLDTALNWDFEIFRLEDMTRGRPLTHLGLSLMAGRFDVCATLDCDEKTLLNWLTVIEMNYHSANTYHNSTHAADVLQAVAYFMEKDRLKSVLEPLEAAAALLAAAAHDVDHPGMSSTFLCNCRHPLAILYNDTTVLENHHAAHTFKLTLNDDRVNILKNLDRETYKLLRLNVIDMILATEMTKHFEHLAKFVNIFYAKGTGSKEDNMHTDVEPLSLDMTALSQPENVTLIKRMMIKCADVSNASRPLKFAFEWARRIAEEYFLQTDEEKAKDLPVVMPMFDRASCSVPRSQIGFIDYIIVDMMEAWAAFIDMQELVTLAKTNYLRWKEMEEAGMTSLADVRKAQRQLSNSMASPQTANTTAEE